jgi:cardiolipin synthase
MSAEPQRCASVSAVTYRGCMPRRRMSLLCALIPITLALASCRAPAARTVASPRTVPATAQAGNPAHGQLSLLVEPDQGLEPVYALIASAHRSLDLTMYELVDTAAALALEVAAGRGVNVRVILDSNNERAANQPAYDELTAMGVHVVWADHRYTSTHEKSLVVDGTTAAIMSLNLTSRYYADTRDYGVVDNNPADVAAIEQVFQADFARQSITPSAGAGLVWSPGQSAPALLGLIDSATSTLLVENEEMVYAPVTSALARAAHRGVRVVVVMTDQPRWHPAFSTLAAAKVSVRTYAQNARLYIHAKAIVSDAGTSHQRAFVGSENFSVASLTHNRELGLLTSDAGVVGTLATTITSDAAAADAWRS